MSVRHTWSGIVFFSLEKDFYSVLCCMLSIFLTTYTPYRLVLLSIITTISSTAIYVLAIQETLGSVALAQAVFSSVLDTEDAGQLATPVHVVEKLHSTLIDVMRNAQVLRWQGRYDRLQPVLISTYSFSDMARIAAGSHWRKFTDVQKIGLIEAFSRMSVAIYASRFDAYKGERFETVAVEKLLEPSPGVMVQTRVIKTDGTEVKLSYRLIKIGGDEWRIVDVLYRGIISELANQRAQYLTVLNGSGYDSLIQRLDEKVEKMATGQMSDD